MGLEPVAPSAARGVGAPHWIKRICKSISPPAPEHIAVGDIAVDEERRARSTRSNHFAEKLIWMHDLVLDACFTIVIGESGRRSIQHFDPEGRVLRRR